VNIIERERSKRGDNEQYIYIERSEYSDVIGNKEKHQRGDMLTVEVS
jgi:hypothetical protein